MMPALLADLVLVLHAAFILFAALGGLLALRWRWIPWAHLPAAVWGGFVEATGRLCPLTPLENALRRAAGGPGYTGDFIHHYLVPVVYPPELTREVQWALAALLGLLNVTIYACVWRRSRRERAGTWAGSAYNAAASPKVRGHSGKRAGRS